jgi:hypothetical protein
MKLLISSSETASPPVRPRLARRSPETETILTFGGRSGIAQASCGSLMAK